MLYKMRRRTSLVFPGHRRNTLIHDIIYHPGYHSLTCHMHGRPWACIWICQRSCLNYSNVFDHIQSNLTFLELYVSNLCFFSNLVGDRVVAGFPSPLAHHVPIGAPRPTIQCGGPCFVCGTAWRCACPPHVALRPRSMHLLHTVHRWAVHAWRPSTPLSGGETCTYGSGDAICSLPYWAVCFALLPPSIILFVVRAMTMAGHAHLSASFDSRPVMPPLCVTATMMTRDVVTWLAFALCWCYHVFVDMGRRDMSNVRTGHSHKIPDDGSAQMWILLLWRLTWKPNLYATPTTLPR